jgi:pterin-4a-carbinolamine dehydratase
MKRALSHNHRLVHQRLWSPSIVTRSSCRPTLSTVQVAGLVRPEDVGDVPCRNFSSSSRPDPFARRPNKVCDPYGQGGKPLSLEDAERLLTTVEDDWKLGGGGGGGGGDEAQEDQAPRSISRDFQHADFLAGSHFLTHMAAVAHMNDHFPSLQLERRLDSRKKEWHVVTSVTCHTKVLQGLSHHDFYLATVRSTFKFVWTDSIIIIIIYVVVVVVVIVVIIKYHPLTFYE